MKLQYHKIRGVDKSVCTAEQKIAYNMASRIYGDIRFAKAWQQYDSGKVPAFLQNDWESNMIWNAAIITDVQLFALACYNVWLYNPIINQTAKQNYFSVFTKLFKSKSA